MLQIEAIVLGRSAAQATDPAARARFTQSGVAALLAAIRADRDTLNVLTLTPDWNALRADPAFRTGLQKQTAGPTPVALK